ncbi:MAG: sialate O-acetylesterase [Spirosomataceae bacterium]
MKKNVILSFLTLYIISLTGFSQIRLPKLISDGVVLQRDKPVKIWGWASPKEKINLNIGNKNYTSTTNSEGKWEIMLPAQPAGGPYEFKLKGKNEVIVKDVLFGDVWLCSGQSNMTIPMERVKEKYPDEIANANYPAIRHFFVATLTNLQKPQEDFPSGSWKEATPSNVIQFSAIAYFFAKEIYEKYKVPIGLINSSVGGTPIEAWISEDGFKDFKDIAKTIQKNKDTTYVNSFFNRTSNQIAPKKVEDLGLIEKWYEPNYQPKGWRNMNIPGFWEDQGLKDLNGVVWFRREIEIPASLVGTAVKFFMGRIVDADQVYVNGKQIGNITYQYPPRRYTVPADLLKEGKNTVVIRVTNTAGKGGFVPDKPYFMTANGKEIDLKGTWQYKVGEVYYPNNQSSGGGFVKQNQPNALYNAMIAPVKNQAIKGILWYQGESNTGKPEEYYDYLPALINDWRNQWNDNNLPFLTVQLANFQDINLIPTESQWAVLRDAQLSATKLNNAATIVTIDLGEWNDIHPLNKRDIGIRLSLAAKKLAYGENIVYSGPTLKSTNIENNKIILDFENVGSGITSKDGEKLRWFAIADYDKKFVWANAEIEGKDRIVVWNDKIKTPKYVRYAWADNPEDVNFYNKEGLPASPFKTDIEVLDSKKAWMGKKCAVVLTYDDALNVHLDNAIPALDSLQLKGTFYLTASSPAGSNRINDWRKAAANGHELGNHTLYHPCDATFEGMSWVKPEYDLSKYTLKRITDEVRMTNTYLESIDGKKQRTFAFTCGHKKVIEGEFIQSLKNDFVAARAVRHEMHGIDQVQLLDIDCYGINGETGEQMINLVKEAMNSGKLLVFLFHGVGGEHSLNVSLPAHRELLRFLKDNEKDIWVAPMIEVAEHVKNYQGLK